MDKLIKRLETMIELHLFSEEIRDYNMAKLYYEQIEFILEKINNFKEEQ